MNTTKKTSHTHNVILICLLTLTAAIGVWVGIIDITDETQVASQRTVEIYGEFISNNQISFFPAVYVIILFYLSDFIERLRFNLATDRFKGVKINVDKFSGSFFYTLYHIAQHAFSLSIIVTLYHVALGFKYLVLSATMLDGVFSLESLPLFSRHYDHIQYALTTSIVLFFFKLGAHTTLTDKEIILAHHNDYTPISLFMIATYLFASELFMSNNLVTANGWIFFALVPIVPSLVYRTSKLSSEYKFQKNRDAITAGILAFSACVVATTSPILSASDDALFGKNHVVINGHSIDLTSSNARDHQITNISVYAAGKIPKLYFADETIKDLLIVGKSEEAKIQNIETAATIQLGHLKNYEENKDTMESVILNKNLHKPIGTGMLSVIVHKTLYDAAPYDVQKRTLEFILARQYQKAVDAYIKDFINRHDQPLDLVTTKIVAAIIDSDLAVLDEDKILDDKKLSMFEECLWSIGSKRNKPENLTESMATKWHQLFVEAARN